MLRPLTLSDLDLVKAWLEADDIRAIFGDPEEWLEEMRMELDRCNWIHHFIFEAPEPIGFCQYYETDKAPSGVWSGQPPGTVGIDYFIAIPLLRQRGMGTQMVRSLLQVIVASATYRFVVADPHPANKASIKLLQKLNFIKISENLFRLDIVD